MFGFNKKVEVEVEVEVEVAVVDSSTIGESIDSVIDWFTPDTSRTIGNRIDSAIDSADSSYKSTTSFFSHVASFWDDEKVDKQVDKQVDKES